MSRLFLAKVQATEESILNALVAAETMVEKNNTTVYEMPEEGVLEILKKYRRIKE